MFQKYFFLIIIFALLSSHSSFAYVPKDIEELFEKGIVVDLRDPEFCEGVLVTEQGGVITGPDMRVQAKKIKYTSKKDAEPPVLIIEAEEELSLNFGQYLIVGSRLEYDFITRCGKVYNGRTGSEPWYFGGETIELCPDGSYKIINGFLTTSENINADWSIRIAEATLDEGHLLRARNVQFRYYSIPLFWLPSFKANLDSIFDTPIKYYIRWGGRLGTRFGAVYEFLSWRRLKAFLRLDYRFKKGLGIGLETFYGSEDLKETLETINYLAQDSSIVHPHEKIRYRFQGVYDNHLLDDALHIDVTWDKLSDKDMATDYNDRGLELDTAGRTQLHVRYEDPALISNFYSRVRVNPFQTVKQELPTLQTHWHPICLGETGIISDTQGKTSYLDFKYSNGLINVHNYHSARFELRQLFYRPFELGFIKATPKLGGTAIYYSDSPQDDPKVAALGMASLELNTRMQRWYGPYKHVVVPYLNYMYLTYPTASPNHHYIFDIEDGLYRLNMLKFGVQQNLYLKTDDGCVNRLFRADIFGNAFFHTKTIHSILPKIYALITYKACPTLRYTLDTAWDIQRTMLDHYNFRTEWTLSPNMAISTEFRYRDKYDWRKVDHQNFILDSYRSVHSLLASELSDRRNTLLFHFFYRFQPNWSVEFESRQGWNRRWEPNYNEYEIDLLVTLQSAWHLKLYYRHREDDDRIGYSLSVGISRPDVRDCETLCPCLEF